MQSNTVKLKSFQAFSKKKIRANTIVLITGQFFKEKRFIQNTKMRSVSSHPRAFKAGSTFLELHSKTALQHSPKTAEIDGDVFKTCKK